MHKGQPSNRAGNGHSHDEATPPGGALLSVEHVREELAYALALEAYLWGFPLYHYATWLAETQRGGFNTFRVAQPNHITLDAHAVFDATYEPVVLHVPRIDPARWYLVQLGDMFDEVFASIGGTHGASPGVYVITGPDFAGTLPGAMHRLASRTKQGIATLRVFAGGDAELPAALEALRGFHLIPLTAYLRDGIAHLATAIEQPPKLHVFAPPELRYFELLGRAMQAFLPGNLDTSDTLVSAFHGIGLSIARGFEWRTLDPPTRRGLARAALAGLQVIDQAWEAFGERTDGWQYVMAGGRAGHDFALRAALAKYMPGAALAMEMLTPQARVDSNEDALSGQRSYVVRFERGQLPPAANWNLALYDDAMRSIDNEIDRHAIGSATSGLVVDEDGSLTITIQRNRPAEPANWLPAPPGHFLLVMQLYAPDARILDGSYRLPAVTRLK